MLKDKRWAIIGTGNIGTLLCKRLLSAGVRPNHLAVYDITPGSTDYLVRETSVKTLSLNRESFQDIDVILIATPPKAVKGFLSQTAEWLHPNHLIISFANAVSLNRLETLTPEGVGIIRVNPNIPSLIGEGINPVVYGRHVTVEAKQLVEELLGILGKTISVRDDQMNWLVGLTGASMRSILPVLEGLIKAGTEAGLSSEEARAVAAQVLVGTADLVLQTGLTIDELKAMTPLVTVDENALSNMIFNAARRAKEKMDIIQSEEEVNG
ncbi:MAG: NAD(P)-binding domain-containing protein [Nitrospirae bacterium]|nr:NAD(P)-binding domain-containing protein [Nitrospirota bacterium]